MNPSVGHPDNKTVPFRMAFHALHGKTMGDGSADSLSRAQIQLLHSAVCQRGEDSRVQGRSIEDRRVEGDLLDVMRRVDQRQRAVERRRDKPVRRVPQRREHVGRDGNGCLLVEGRSTRTVLAHM
ncbi:hypothetical protein KL930_004286 [Ogataea haglerorum]|uniref:Uncharacterized protein n=1 Tax=Ogataea haglerorum TaxID=1937702 RepID=A0AAN6D3V2_9ASCO|nr:hypothetical protein KL950_004256 [Ogataea haglerorum]KAG7725523.1 hypothetical protein KL933_004089 [Ogataea haglerorum]KAG7728311.1 hypothetical protein KL948_004178 [Ogataea haglerorum]KAG7736761.1 hypothetical protein KL923_004344 [Ogataea haglerorum]KAG7765687.1 hypothetical protein KL931_004338 [Ogataea haglerorum]